MLKVEKTESNEYTKRLVKIKKVWWKQLLPVHLPYAIHARTICSGSVLEIGCGIGRNLGFLKKSTGKGNQIIGIDHNRASVEYCKVLGYQAYAPEEFKSTRYFAPASFDTILLSHLLEHMSLLDVIDLLSEYLFLLKKNGRVIIITPQEVGQASDSTHILFYDFELVKQLCEKLNLEIQSQYSFPFFRALGKIFIYNEFITIAKKP